MRPDDHSWRWLNQHAKSADFWYGEVDYTGACDTARDPDCDHWYTEHDNCPAVANPQQVDSDDDGVGDGCPVPPPSVGPDRCISVEWCDGNVNIECPMVGEALVLRRLVGGAWKDVNRNATLIGTAVDGYLLSLHDNGGGQADGTYMVCSENTAGIGPCSGPIRTRYDNSSCGRSGGGGGGGGGDYCSTCNPGPVKRRIM